MTRINAQINPSTKIVAKTVTLHDVSAESVGLGDVDNTSDIDKPISTLTQSALDLKADQSTTYTKVEVDNNIANLVDSAPAALDTLNELAAALGDDANFATTIADSIATKASQTDLNTHIGDTNNPHTVTATQIGLGDVDNTSDINKPISTLTQSALDLKANADDVTTNTSNIATNTSGIATNESDIESLESKVYPYTTDFTSGIARTQNLTTISGFANTSVDSIYIGSNATSIGDSAFYFCFSLASLNIPDSVTSIGDSAFYWCHALTSLNIPDSVTSIGGSAFNFCHALTSINIPDSITSIGANAFERCYSLLSMTFPEGLTSIPDYCNADCGSIPSVSIPNSVTSIGEYAFAFCYSLNTVNCLATAAPTLGSSAFDYIGATEIHVPVGATGYGTTYGGLTVVYDL